MSEKKEEGMLDSIGTFLFGKRMTPDEYVKKWKRDLNKERRELDRQVRGIEREEQKVKRECRAAAKRGDLSSARTLAKELVRSKHAKERLAVSKARLNIIQMQLLQHHATFKMAATLKKSAEIMHMMNEMLRLPEMQRTMMVLAREMEKAGLIDEIMQDTLEMGEEDVEDEADEAVQKVLDELDLDLQEAAPAAPQRARATEAAAEDAEEEKEAAEDAALQARLNSLNNPQ